MKLDKKIDAKFQELLKEGESIMGKHIAGEGRWSSWPLDWVLSEWYTSVKKLNRKSLRRKQFSL